MASSGTVIGVGLLVGLFGVAGVLLFLVERAPALRPQLGRGASAVSSPALGALMLAGAAGILVLCLPPTSGNVKFWPVSIAVALLGASEFSWSERAALWLRRTGMAALWVSLVLLSWQATLA